MLLPLRNNLDNPVKGGGDDSIRSRVEIWEVRNESKKKPKLTQPKKKLHESIAKTNIDKYRHILEEDDIEVLMLYMS